jgi:hypothetical protein
METTSTPEERRVSDVEALLAERNALMTSYQGRDYVLSRAMTDTTYGLGQHEWAEVADGAIRAKNPFLYVTLDAELNVSEVVPTEPEFPITGEDIYAIIDQMIREAAESQFKS